MIDLSNRSKIIRQLNGGLKWAIKEHGPITKENYGSASKRIYVVLLQYQREVTKSRRKFLLPEKCL